MEEYTQITLDEWMQWKEDIKKKLQETAGNFVHIGYRLRQIRDSGMLDGAADIFEFAQREFGLSKSTTSRFIAVNERFADPYNPLLIKPEFEKIGSSKLSEMLTLPEEECMLITEKTTVKEIRDLKNFNKQEVTEEKEEQEEKKTEQESEENSINTSTEKKYTPLQKCIIEFFREKQTILDKTLEKAEEQQWKEAMETMNPSGYASCKKGMCFLFLYDFNRGISYKLLTEQNPINMSWEDFLKEVMEVYEGQTWKSFYRTKMEPEKEETKSVSEQGKSSVATSQQEEKIAVPQQQEQKNVQAQQETTKEEENVIKQPENVIKEPENVIKEPENAILHDFDEDIPEPDPMNPPEQEEEQGQQSDAEGQQSEELPGQDKIENHEEWMPEKSTEHYKSEEINTFIKECIDMAKENWSQREVDMLYRLIESVKRGCEYKCAGCAYLGRPLDAPKETDLGCLWDMRHDESEEFRPCEEIER